jgi:DNA-nicking Smr family endonuclease
VEGTRFDESEDGARIMEEALRSDVASLNEKFQGAVRGTGKRRAIAPARTVRSTSTADPDDELDLHGKTQEEAIRMVQNFLLRAKHKRLRAVLIITGRGLNSGEHGPVLRNAVQSWLERNAGTAVRRFAWAPPRLGGDGAIWVELW